MRLLVVGGSGHVGSLVLPGLVKDCEAVRIFDLLPPATGGVEHVAGDVRDYEALALAAQGMDAVLYMAMGRTRLPVPASHNDAFDVNVKGVHLALLAAQEAGITHAVYTSSMSVYRGRLEERDFVDEALPPDANALYGFTKRLGEEVCQNAARSWGMSVNALRLCFPIPDEQWVRETERGKPTIATAASDVTRALLAALRYRGAGFEAFMISGDYEQKYMRMAKAKRFLDWEPLARPA